MPLLRRWKPAPHLETLLWRIEEPEVFFAMRTGLIFPIKNGQRRIEYLAGRFALTQLLPDVDLDKIVIGENGKPYLPAAENVPFSLSHSFPFVAVLVSEKGDCGIDIQVPKRSILEIQYKFLTGEEKALFAGREEMVLWAWSVKESLYKKANNSETQLKRDIHMTHVEGEEDCLHAVCSIQTAGGKRFEKVFGEVHKSFALAWTE